MSLADEQNAGVWITPFEASDKESIDNYLRNLTATMTIHTHEVNHSDYLRNQDAYCKSLIRQCSLQDISSYCCPSVVKVTSWDRAQCCMHPCSRKLQTGDTAYNIKDFDMGFKHRSNESADLNYVWMCQTCFADFRVCK